MHSGKSKKLVFDINNFSKFKDKIIYNVVDKLPSSIEPVYDNDNYDKRTAKLINNSAKRENYQREMAQKSLEDLEDNDRQRESLSNTPLIIGPCIEYLIFSIC